MLQENIVEKGEIAQNDQFHLFPLATFQLSSAASLNFGRSQLEWCVTYRDWINLLILIGSLPYENDLSLHYPY